MKFTAINRISLLFITSLCFIFTFDAALAQDVQQKDIQQKDIQQAVEDAVKNIQAENEKAEAERSAELKSKLSKAVKAWVQQARQEKERDLSQLLHESWSGADIKEVTYPVPYDYFLKSFSYPVVKADCVKTDSVVSPYQAYAQINEVLYVESYHPSNIDDPTQYGYTITKPITITFDYQDDDFRAGDIEYGQVIIERGW